MNPFKNQKEIVKTSPRVSDEIKQTTCYMCACRCGIDVHLRDGKVRYIQGNRDHPVNKGVLCAKGSAGIMQHYSPARLSKPLKRVGPRGAGEFEEIEWDEALEMAVSWLAPLRESVDQLQSGNSRRRENLGWCHSRSLCPRRVAPRRPIEPLFHLFPRTQSGLGPLFGPGFGASRAPSSLA